ncbi:MAG: hypothetical protein ACYTGZ_05865 [Planctomycetota bacterium]|jgi:hypothetical protein
MPGAIAYGSGEDQRPPEPRLQRKIKETRAIASENGLDLHAAPLLVTFDMPLWGQVALDHEIASLARLPGAAMAVLSADPLPVARELMRHAPYLHVIAEGGLVCGLTGGATLHIYPPSTAEMQAFAVAVFAGAAAHTLCLSLSSYVSCGRQEVTFETPTKGSPLRGRELMHGIRDCGGSAVYADEGEHAVVLAEAPAELEALRRVLVGNCAHRSVRLSRLPSGRFRVEGETSARPIDPPALQAAAQGLAISCDRFVEIRGPGTFGFTTERVAKGEFGPERAAMALGQELFNAPDTVVTHLGLAPFTEEGSLFFAYEGSETVWDAANKGVACITVRDIAEYGRILAAIRRGE